MTTTVSASARVRARRQMTIPEAIAEAAGIEEGETFLVELVAGDRDVLHLRRVRESYAGALRGLYGDTAAYLEGERRDW
jgi:AbrB family looped-hinge helix DNA binding protein